MCRFGSPRWPVPGRSAEGYGRSFEKRRRAFCGRQRGVGSLHSNTSIGLHLSPSEEEEGFLAMICLGLGAVESQSEPTLPSLRGPCKSSLTLRRLNKGGIGEKKIGRSRHEAVYLCPPVRRIAVAEGRFVQQQKCQCHFTEVTLG